ncbi:hypothetical protein E2C01_070172 [Portunus trituberculatus]|uniref:Uncharacterized protein n=1 Tax=Portunus trituberculatus TaxID=210409 RepID=A0A5B7I2T8_PORTR|nr:hypothetical protein [Portunus trituberculatus]
MAWRGGGVRCGGGR